MRLEEIRVYDLALELAEKVWEIVNKWNYFAKDTIGKQLIRAVDSVAANISEGFEDITTERISNSAITVVVRFMKQRLG